MLLTSARVSRLFTSGSARALGSITLPRRVMSSLAFPPVELVNKIPQNPAAATSHALLLAHKETGPYSVMRASGPDARVFHLSQHVERIALAVAATATKLHIAGSSAVPAALTAASAATPAAALTPAAPSVALQDAVAASLRAHAQPALALFNAGTAGVAGNHTAPQQPKDVRILYLLSPRPAEASADPGMAAAALAALAAETTASGQASANASAPDSTAALSTAIDAAFDVTVHVGALPPRPSPPVAASVRRARRPHGAVKDSSWVHEAKALEDSMRADENEVVMFDSEAGIYSEGLSSNFYVLLRTDSTADGGVYGSVDADDTSAGAAADIGAGWELQTAREGVLLGTVRTAALGVARALGVHVVEAAPREQDRARWRGCAVSSTSRLFLPLDELRFPDTEGGAVAAVFCGDREAMRVMRALQEGVDRVLAEQSTPLVPPTLEHHA